MSRVGSKPVPIPKGVTVTVSGAELKVKGPKGELSWTCPDRITIQPADGVIKVARATNDAQSRMLHGTARSLVANMIQGVAEGYSKELEIQGVGYKAALQGRKLVLNLGFSHPVEVEVPQGITVQVTPDGLRLTVSGADKQLVGDLSARIRGYKRAEPYKGKGVRYKNEYVRRKAGKTVA